MAYNNRGDILVSKGDMPEAEEMFAKALSLKPDFANAFINLTSIRKYCNVNHVDIKTIQTILTKPDTSSDDKELLYFALGKFLMIAVLMMRRLNITGRTTNSVMLRFVIMPKN